MNYGNVPKVKVVKMLKINWKTYCQNSYEKRCKTYCGDLFMKTVESKGYDKSWRSSSVIEAFIKKNYIVMKR